MVANPVSVRGETLPIEIRPDSFFNRELSWLEFNHRVLEEALDEGTPLLERVNFLSIFGSNLDEFFMIRVSGLRRQMEAGVIEAPPDGMTPAEQLLRIRETLQPMLERWQRWSGNKVRGRLCDEAEALHGSGLHPDALATRVKELQAEWARIKRETAREHGRFVDGIEEHVLQPTDYSPQASFSPK